MLTGNDQITYRVGRRKRLPRNQNKLISRTKWTLRPNTSAVQPQVVWQTIYVNATIRDVRVIIVAAENKKNNNTHSECFYLYSWIGYPECKAFPSYWIIICGLSALTHFTKLSHKRDDFREKIIEHKMCVLIFSTKLSETFLILRKIQRNIINVYTSSCKVPVNIVTF
jgi:hypothetical protein